MHIYGKDYIKYLNDEGSGRITYDQWKSRNFKQKSEKYGYNENYKDHLHQYPKCK